tara:strand:+ start:663 stop:1022 length:360 start_codon:yes stop_codon:yes gene_type:complete
MNDKKKLIFIYNANSGVINAAIDYLHKMFSPETYNCSLCSLTYNNFGKIGKWKKFLDSCNYDLVFIYRDHLEKMGIDRSIKLPAILLTDYSILITSSEIQSYENLDELIKNVRLKIDSR